MANVLVPLGQHLFTPAQLDALAARALAEIPDDKHGGLVFDVDANGAQVAVVLQRHAGPFAIKFVTAFTHTLEGDNTVGASGVVAF
jgi:hypothetical protein